MHVVVGGDRPPLEQQAGAADHPQGAGGGRGKGVLFFCTSRCVAGQTSEAGGALLFLFWGVIFDLFILNVWLGRWGPTGLYNNSIEDCPPRPSPLPSIDMSTTQPQVHSIDMSTTQLQVHSIDMSTNPTTGASEGPLLPARARQHAHGRGRLFPGADTCFGPYK